MRRKKAAVNSVRARKFFPPFFGLLILSRTAHSQQAQPEIIQPPNPEVESQAQLAMPNEFQVFPLPQAPVVKPPYEPFQIGPAILRPHIDFQYLIAHGLLAAPGVIVNSTIQTISPGILIDIGDHWALDDTVTMSHYSNKDFANEFDNTFTLSGSTEYLSWLLGFTQTADESRAPSGEIAGQTETQTYQTSITGHHQNSEHVSEDLSFNQTIFFITGDFDDSRDWNTLDFLNYDFGPGVNAGIGGELGYVNVDFGSDQTYEQALGRFNWRATRKISFQFNGGIEEREFLASSSGALANPVFGGSLQYQPFDTTSFYAGASRAVTQSYFRGEVTEATAFSAGFNQRFLQQFYFSLNGGYTTDRYIVEGDTLQANRIDHYYLVGARLSHSFLERGTIAIFYSYSDQRSTAPGFTYKSSQAGIEVGYSF